MGGPPQSHTAATGIDATTDRGEGPNDVRSLFVVSLPRSLSSHVYQVARRAVGLREPVWTSSGEILNLDRFALLSTPAEIGAKYTTRRARPQRFAQITAFLDQIVERRCYAYKDTVQPFVVSGWIASQGQQDDPLAPRASPPLAVLVIAPDVTHTAQAMLRRNWSYPRAAATVRADPTTQLVDGLLHAARALTEIPGEAVAYDDLLESERPLVGALERLYPGVELGPIRYLSEQFVARREQYRLRRAEPEYQRLAELVAERRLALADDPVRHVTRPSTNVQQCSSFKGGR